MYIKTFLCALMLYVLSCNNGEKKNTESLFSDRVNISDFKIKANFDQIFSDIEEKRFYHPAELYYKTKYNEIVIPIKIKTRGYFRRDTDNCELPPLKLNFSKKNSSKTIFKNQDKIKLTYPCNNDYSSNQLVIREYILYKIYELLTPYSFKCKFVQMQLLCTQTNNSWKLNAFFIENKNDMAKRNNCNIKEIPYLKEEKINDYMYHFMMTFQFFAGNKDWSVYNLHNIVNLYSDKISKAIPVPYDFDMSAFVNAPYAIDTTSSPTAEEQHTIYDEFDQLKKEIGEEELNYIAAVYIEKKEKIYALINNNKNLDRISKAECLSYINTAYSIIETFYEENNK